MIDEKKKRNQKKNSMKLYYDSLDDAFEVLDDKQIGVLMRKILEYELYGGDIPQTDDKLVNYALNSICKSLDRNMVDYEKKCQTNADNANKRWNNGVKNVNTDNAVACGRIQSNAVDADTETDKDTETDTETDKDTDKESDSDIDIDINGAFRTTSNGVDSQHYAQPNLEKLIYENIGEHNQLFGEIISIIRYFLKKYYDTFNTPHNKIQKSEIENIINNLAEPYSVTDDYDVEYAILNCIYDDYVPIIDNYFDTKMECDYSIYHFLSGKIRANRYFTVYY